MRLLLFYLYLLIVIIGIAQTHNPELTRKISKYKLPAHKTEREILFSTSKPLNKTNNSLKTDIFPVTMVTVPAEYEESQAVCISWSYDYDAGGNPTIVDTSSEYGWVSEQLADAIQKECMVWIRVKSAADTVILKRYMQSRATPLYHCKFIIAPMDDWWMRDYGPIGFYYGTQDSLAFLDLKYYDGRDNDNIFPSVLSDSLGINNYETELNAEGGNIMTDGWGKLFFSNVITSVNTSFGIHTPVWTVNNTLDSCSKYFGASVLLITKALHCDGGTGHIDLYLKLIDDEHLMVMQMPSEVTAQDKQLIEDNLQTIKGFNTAYNRPFKVYRIPTPTNDTGGIVKTCAKISDDARTYINGLTVNKTFIYPKYSDNVDGNSVQDAEVEAYFHKLMPGYKLVGIDSRVICANGGGGELHCITMQIPVDNPLRIWHPSIEGYIPFQNKYHLIVKATNRSGIDNVICHWRKKGSTVFVSLNLTDSSGYSIGDIQDNSIIPSDEIEYYISATANNGKMAVRPIVAPEGFYNFYFTQKAGVDHNEVVLKNHLFSLQPNPANSFVDLKYRVMGSGQAKFLVTDITGKIISSTEHEVQEGLSELRLDLSGFAKGMYFCTFIFNDDQVITRRFIVR